MGAILAPRKRTVTSALRVMGLSQDEHFQSYHRVLNRALWSNLAAARILLSLLVSAFAPTGAVVMGLDDTIERRRGEKIKALENVQNLQRCDALTIRRKLEHIIAAIVR